MQLCFLSDYMAATRLFLLCLRPHILILMQSHRLPALSKYLFISLLFFSFKANSYAQSTAVREKQSREKIIQTARRLLGYKGNVIRVKGKSFRYDCSGFVTACYYGAGFRLDKAISSKYRSRDIALSIYRSTQKVAWKNSNKRPRPGDLIFFDNTYDRNRNGRWDDIATHIGIVEKVHPDGRIHWIHLVRQGIVRYVTHLKHPRLYAKGRTKFNDFLRRRPTSDKNKGKYLSGNLFSSFANPFPLLKKEARPR